MKSLRKRVGWFGLLRKYLQLYWLKPFDAVNDTANAWALRQFDWQEPILELGSGDGVFSFIMHGGEYIFTDDRYDQSNPKDSGDIFDVYHKDRPLTIKNRASIFYNIGVDLKWSHIQKCKETGLYKHLVVSPPAPLPFADHSFKTVFLYFPHGLIEREEQLRYQETLKEIRRVLHPDGIVLMTALNQNISKFFICHQLYRFLFRIKMWRLSRYFQNLDAGRYREISGLSLAPDEWQELFKQSGFELSDAWTHIKPFAWRVYDFQTRPILRLLIQWNWSLKRLGFKKLFKFCSVMFCLPILGVFYLLFAKPKRISPDLLNHTELAFVFKAVPVGPPPSEC